MEKYIGKDIIVLSNRIKRRMRVAAEALGITDTQGRVLQYIWEESEKREVFQKDIEDEFDIRRSSVTQIIQLLERDGLIVRESVQRDARLKKLVLTEKAIEIQKVMNGKVRELEAEMQKDISPEEKELFLKILCKIRKNVM
ncbi:MAG: MarR family transcriptional regulator [Lachnospiraceae bacterium]|nr:MarR family transcriptional regulator [Lachnospiraceae bacterium]MEE1342432.1 MarR family transcriptional regulator [Lachnospiraceae bacterium]